MEHNEVPKYKSATSPQLKKVTIDYERKPLEMGISRGFFLKVILPHVILALQC